MVPSDSEESLLSQRLPQRKSSLESLYFTPILRETPLQLESSTSSPGDFSLNSGCKTRSARRRTTINITMTDVSRGPLLGNAGIGSSTAEGPSMLGTEKLNMTCQCALAA